MVNIYVINGVIGIISGILCAQAEKGTKAFDIIALDYFLLTKTNFFQNFFPETKGLAGWQDFGYNRKQQLSHIAVMLISCFVIAFIFTKI